MLKRFYKKKLVLCLLVFFSIFLVYIVPNEKEKINIKEELVYVDKSIDMQDIFLLDSNNYIAKTKIVSKEKKINSKFK